MSIHVMSLCFRAAFGCPKRKAVALALADHADDDGTSVYPSVDRIACKTEWGERTVQRTLRDLEELGLIVCVNEGGRGAKDTREYKFDMQKLSAMAAGMIEIERNKGVSGTPCEDNKGDCQTPSDDARVSTRHPQGVYQSNKGVHQTPEPSLTIIEPSTAPLPPSPAEPQRSGQMNFKNSGRAGPIITIRAGHNGWEAWLNHIEARLGVRQREAAEAFGELDVTTRWPRDETPMPIIGRSA